MQQGKRFQVSQAPNNRIPEVGERLCRSSSWVLVTSKHETPQTLCTVFNHPRSKETNKKPFLMFKGNPVNFNVCPLLLVLSTGTEKSLAPSPLCPLIMNLCTLRSGSPSFLFSNLNSQPPLLREMPQTPNQSVSLFPPCARLAICLC